MPKNRQKQQSNIRVILNRWIQSTTFHGLPKIAKTRNITIRIIWILILFTSTIICSYLIVINIINYLDFGVITKIQKITELPSLLPTITVCNLNPFVTNYSHQYLRTLFSQYNLSENNVSFKQKNSTKDSNFIIKNLNLLKFIGIINANTLKDDEKRKFGYKIEEMLISCYINGIECSAEDFKWIYDPIYGNCYILNSGIDLKSSFSPGKLNGIQLELYVGPESLNSLIRNIGAHVYIHNNSISPKQSEGFDLPTQISSNIAINRVFSNRITQPYSNCIDSRSAFQSDLYSILSRLNNSYRQIDCYELCFQLNTNRKCKCYDTRVLNFNSSLKPCLSFKEIECAIETFNEYLNGKLNSECAKKCPLECTTYSFTEFSSFTQYPTDNYARTLLDYHPIFELQSNDIERLKKNILAVNIYYETLEYTVVDELERTLFFDLISGIGGTFGLFLGTSFLSFIELFEIIFKVFSTCVKNIFKK